MSVVPAAWMPAAKMFRIHVHWTGGTYTPNSKDKSSYHFLVTGEPSIVQGDKSVKANERLSGMTPASHTLNANTGAIGISICSMGGTDVKEKPFVPGKYPITREQWDLALKAIADLSKRYNIPVTPQTILTHAEVQTNLGIAQKNKWDITRLVFMPEVVGAKPIGDLMRRSVAAILDGGDVDPVTPPDSMKAGKFEVTGVRPSTLTFRDGPNGQKKGSLPEVTIVEKLEEQGGWWKVRTPAGYVGWVWSSYLTPA